jgi:CHAD domain-containing protein
VFFRDLSRQLSVARDNQVLLQRAKVTHKNMRPGIRNARADELINELELNREKSLKELAEGNNIIKTISNELNLSTSRIDSLKIKNEGFNVIEKGIERIYKQAQKYLYEIEKNPDPETIHNFRKRVKYLWYQMILLKPIYSRMLKAYCKSLEKISEEFGLHRDYTLFRQLMENNAYFGLNKKQIDFIRDFTDKEQNKIFTGAIEPSKKFFIESPGTFIMKLKNYYELSLTMSII